MEIKHSSKSFGKKPSQHIMIEQRGFMQNANEKELVKRAAMFEKAFDVVLQHLLSKDLIKHANKVLR
jgi:hypothetical protein